jgi:hypothetical protein
VGAGVGVDVGNGVGVVVGAGVDVGAIVGEALGVTVVVGLRVGEKDTAGKVGIGVEVDEGKGGKALGVVY